MRIVLCLAALVAISGLSVAAQDQKPAAPAAESKMPPEAAKVPLPARKFMDTIAQCATEKTATAKATSRRT
jgi:hypothetical protein